jgi:hypothetical protein
VKGCVCSETPLTTAFQDVPWRHAQNRQSLAESTILLIGEPGAGPLSALHKEGR